VGIHDLWLFIVAGLLLNITPGPDMALVIARSARFGSRDGSAAALGIGAGCFVHIAAAALGVSALVMASATAFTVLKWVGAAYLVYLGLSMLRGSPSPAEAGAGWTVAGAFRSAFLHGFLTNALNPKVAVFFLAFLPQFIDADAPSKAAAFLVLGCLFNVTGTAWNLAVAWFAGRVGRSPSLDWLRVWLERTLGALFVAAGVRLAFWSQP
jgi:threonine/homoserine/homoserine lactone efflux protein